MQPEFTCTECENKFDSASMLLKHFAAHASFCSDKLFDSQAIKKDLPDLFPISLLLSEGQNESDKSSDSGVEDVCPSRFCLVTMDEQLLLEASNQNLKKYQCSYCQKRFGWSTDLKRHILIHTGERPFRCRFCDLDFTRKFVLQNHEKKVHHAEVLTGVPALKPLRRMKKSR